VRKGRSDKCRGVGKSEDGNPRAQGDKKKKIVISRLAQGGGRNAPDSFRVVKRRKKGKAGGGFEGGRKIKEAPGYEKGEQPVFWQTFGMSEEIATPAWRPGHRREKEGEQRGI